MKHALYLPPFGELADPRALVEVAQAAEAADWDGVFLWDHVLRPPGEPLKLADPWVALAAMAGRTDRIRLGPMVTPLVRRRPQKLARETATLDELSRGRLTIGLGLGVDAGRELGAFGELTDERQRGDLLDEGADLLACLLSGDEVDHRGRFFTADHVTFPPSPVQRPHPPIWLASRGRAQRPVRRAARYQGLFPIEVDLDRFSEIRELVERERGGIDGFDLAVLAHPGVDLAGFASRGATWAMHSFLPGETPGEVLEYLSEEHRTA